MYMYFNTIIVEESNVHANKAFQDIEKEKQTLLAWLHRELETCTLALQ